MTLLWTLISSAVQVLHSFVTYMLYCLFKYLNKEIIFGSLNIKSLLCHRAFEDLSLGHLYRNLQLKQVSISHQTLCTYISSKLTPCESVELYDHVITTYIIII